jgi:uncharacterized protein YqeY
MASEMLNSLLGDIKTAMKEKDAEKLLTLRTLHAEIKNLEINQRKEITDADVAAVAAKGIKQRQDAIEQYTSAGRQELAAREEAQIELYRRYQPKQLDEHELSPLIDEAIRESGAQTKKDMGAVMKILMPRVKGRADGAMVNTMVNQRLA